jgi:hypothetical protein
MFVVFIRIPQHFVPKWHHSRSPSSFLNGSFVTTLSFSMLYKFYENLIRIDKPEFTTPQFVSQQFCYSLYYNHGIMLYFRFFFHPDKM